jgi:sugar phosphate permease
MNVTNIWYYVGFFICNGVLQSAGYPCCITIVTNWIGKKDRGFYLGLWSTSVNVGNIIGSFYTSFIT